MHSSTVRQYSFWQLCLFVFICLLLTIHTSTYAEDKNQEISEYLNAHEYVKDTEVEKKTLVSDGIKEYYHYIDALDSTEKESILSAKDRYRELFQGDNEEAEVAFRIFLDFFRSVIKNSENVFYTKDDFNNALGSLSAFAGTGTKNPLTRIDELSNDEATSIKQRYDKEIDALLDYMKCGFSIYYLAEGIWAFKPDYRFVENSVLKGFDFELKEYIHFLAEESGERIWQEGYLLLSWENLRLRIVRWEDFAQNHSTLPETKSEMNEEIRKLYIAYLYGGWDPNRMAYNSNSMMLNNDLKSDYKKYLIENHDSDYYEVMKQVYAILKKHDFRYSQELKVFLIEHSLKCSVECPGLK